MATPLAPSVFQVQVAEAPPSPMGAKNFWQMVMSTAATPKAADNSPPGAAGSSDKGKPEHKDSDAGSTAGSETGDKALSSHQKSLTRDAREKEMQFHLNNVTNLRRRYDTLKHRAHVKVARFEELKEQLAELIAEQDQNEECERSLVSSDIVALQVQHQEALDEVDAAVARRRQLEHMRRRTRFDHGVLEAEVENEKKALGVAQEEANHHALLARAELNELKVTKKKLKEFERHMEDTIADYESKLERRRIGAEQHTQILELREEMENKRKSIRDAEKNHGAPVVTNRKKMVTNAFKALQLKQRIMQEENRAGEFEARYEKVKEAVGGDTIDEVVERIASQRQTRADIAQMAVVLQREYQNLLVESSNLDIQLQDIKYSGIGHVTKERQLLAEYDQRLKQLETDIKVKHDTVMDEVQLITSIKSGLWNLSKKLEKVDLPNQPIISAQGTSFDISDAAEPIATDLAAAVAQCEWRVIRLLDTMLLHDVEHVNVLSLLPSERNVMVQTEQERELGLDQSLRDDNATGSALAQPGLEDDAESDEEVDRDAVKALAEDIRHVAEMLKQTYEERFVAKLRPVNGITPTIPAAAKREIEQKANDRVAELIKKNNLRVQAVVQAEHRQERTTRALPGRSGSVRTSPGRRGDRRHGPSPQSAAERRRRRLLQEILAEDRELRRRKGELDEEEDERHVRRRRRSRSGARSGRRAGDQPMRPASRSQRLRSPVATTDPRGRRYTESHASQRPSSRTGRAVAPRPLDTARSPLRRSPFGQSHHHMGSGGRRPSGYDALHNRPGGSRHGRSLTPRSTLVHSHDGAARSSQSRSRSPRHSPPPSHLHAQIG